MLKPVVILALLLVFTAPEYSRADVQDSRVQLDAIQQRIENIQIDLAKNRQAETSLSRELAVLERTLQNIDRRIAQLDKEQQEVAGRINAQQARIDAGKRSLRRVSRRVEKRLVALYKEGEVGPLRILFSTDSPTELVQQYQYLTRVLDADNALIGEYRQALQEQQEQLTELQRLKTAQRELLDKKQQERRSAARGQRLQAKVLKQVRADKGRITAELAGLQEKSRRLQALVKKLERAPESAAAAIPVPPGGVEFKSGKGRLAWPVDGEVLIGFGTQKDSQLGTIYESNGIEISAADGQPMRAVANGTVVFADWFKGYGNLLILSHAGGYHTLYAQAARLEYAIGESVQAGDRVGYSGLAGRDSIYFEIRHNGAPVNPLKWLKRPN